MDFKFFFKKFPRGYLVLEKTESKINGQIEVREDIFGKRGIFVNKLSQSGHLVERLWQKPIKRVISFRFSVKSCLILGAGAGSVAKVIHKFFPEAKILGVEIDPMMIKLGKKYFNLSTVKNLEIKICDAISTINHKQSLLLRNQSSTINQFDLILVDIYLGDEVPEKAKADEFIMRVKKSLSPSGMAIFIRLYYGKKKKEANQFESRLKEIFPQVESLRISPSIFFLCR